MEYIDLTKVDGLCTNSISSSNEPSDLIDCVRVKLEELVLSRSPFFAKGRSATGHLYSVARGNANREVSCSVERDYQYDPLTELRNFIGAQRGGTCSVRTKVEISPAQREYFDYQVKAIKFSSSKAYYLMIPPFCEIEDVQSALSYVTRHVNVSWAKQKAIMEHIFYLTMNFSKF